MCHLYVSNAVHSWPAATTAHHGINLALLSKSDHLMQLTSRQLSSLEQLKESSIQALELNAVRATAALGWAEITCLCLSQELDISSAPKMHLEGGLVGVTSNASNACHKLSSLPVLLGYLSRRYQYTGTATSSYSIATRPYLISLFNFHLRL